MKTIYMQTRADHFCNSSLDGTNKHHQGRGSRSFRVQKAWILLIAWVRIEGITKIKTFLFITNGI